MAITGCGAEMKKLMDVSHDDVTVISDSLDELIGLGVPRKLAQVQAVDEALAQLAQERQRLERAAAEQIAVPAQEGSGYANPLAAYDFPAATPVPNGLRYSQREFDEVVKKYRDTDQWMKAPNGQPTKLNERQWVQVRTPSFKNWFGDWEAWHKKGGVWADDEGKVSKAVDANGEPMVLYHGTDKGGFMEFNQPGGQVRGDIGIFTTDNWDMARSYVRKNRASQIEAPKSLDYNALENDGYEFEVADEGKINLIGPDGYTIDGPADNDFVFPSVEAAVAAANAHRLENDDGAGVQPGVYGLFANIRHPQEADFEGAMWSGSRDHQWIVEVGGEQQYDADGKGYFDDLDDAKEFAATFLSPEDQEEGRDAEDYVRAADEHHETTDMVARDGVRHGDGAIINNVVDDGGGPGAYYGTPSTVVVLKSPSQLKSADFNLGTFSPKTADLRYSKRVEDSKSGQDPAIGDKTDVSLLPRGREIPASVAVGSLASSFEIARGKTYARGRELKQDIQAAVLKAAKAAKVDLSARTQATHRFLANMVYGDAMYALKTNENAIGWYDQKVSRAIGAVSVIHPEINTVPEARLAFLWGLAVTSNGLKVDKNFELAESAYRQWKASHEDVTQRVMPSRVGIGNAAKAINDGMAMFNDLTSRLGHERAAKFMATEFPAGDITRMLGLEVGGEWKGTPVRGAAILGPKIGNGFYMNLNGYFDALTMDRWLMRTYGRMTGTLLDIDPKAIDKARDKVKTAVAAMTPPQRKLMADLTGVPVRQNMTRAELDTLAAAVDKASMKTDKREQMQADEKTNRFRLDARTLAKAIDGQKEAPSGPAERNWIRAIFSTALGQLRDAGKGMTMSDLQALLWYPERRLYDAAKADENIEEGYEDDDAPDYANAAMKLAIDNGANRADVLRAMDEAEARGTVRAATLTDAEKSAMLGDMRAAPKQPMQLMFEVAPDPANAQAVQDWSSLSAKERAAITSSVRDAVLDDILAYLGVDLSKVAPATGGFAGEVNPNLIGEYQKTKVSFAQARRLAAAIGYVLDQDSVALADPRSSQEVEMIRLTFDKKPDAYVGQIFSAIRAAAPEIDAFTLRGNNFDVLNFTGLPNGYIVDRIKSALEDLNLPLSAVGSHGAIKSELVSRSDYESDLEGIRPGDREGVRAELDGLRSRAREIVAGGIDAARARRAAAAGLAERAAPKSHFSSRDERGQQPGRSAADDADGRAERAARGASQGQAAGRGVGQQDPGVGRQGSAGGDRVGAGAARSGQEAGRLKPLAGAPTADPVRAGTSAGPDPRLVSVAERYARDHGIDLRRQSEYVEVDPERAKRLAQAYADMPHAPQDPVVREAYANLIRQTIAQYHALEDAGYQFWLFDENSDPYNGNPWAAMADLRENRSMAVYSTAAGFGTSDDFTPDNNPLLAETGIRWPHGSPTGELRPVLANDLFRAVHDAFGHGLEGTGFRARGEENAWQAHVRLFTGSAVGAITSETRGQNSWLNFGPKGEDNQTASVFDTAFADQKTGLMPEWTWTEGRAGDAPQFSGREDQTETPEFKRWAQGLPVHDSYEGRGSDRGVFRLYHMTTAEFDEFKPGGNNPSDSGHAIWLATDPSTTAAAFRVGNAQSGFREGARTMPVYARLKNPLVVDDKGMLEFARNAYAGGSREFPQLMTKRWVDDLKADGYDSVIFDGQGVGWKASDNEVIVFSPDQIKSAIGNSGAFNPDDARIHLSSRDPLGYFSELYSQLDKAAMKQAPAGAWKAFIKGLPAKGVKADEIEWSGINGWLDQQPGKVSKDEVLAYLDSNGVQVNEVVLGATGLDSVGEMRIEQLEYSGNWAVMDEEDRVIGGTYDTEQEAQSALDSMANDLPSKYGSYTLPGGQNYREVLLTLPSQRDSLMAQKTAMEERGALLQGNPNYAADRAVYDGIRDKLMATQDYKSAHWDQPNILAHIRVNDRTDADGNKVLFVEELQSDWGQDGKKKGFGGVTVSGFKFDEATGDWVKTSDSDATHFGDASGRDDTLWNSREEAARKLKAGVPAAPFVTKTDGWLNLALKRVITMAIEGDYDKVAFVNGEQSADRYDLSKQVDSIDWKPASKDGRTTVSIKTDRGTTTGLLDAKTGEFPQFESAAFGGKRLDEVVGKELADKILSQTSGSLSGEGLKVGGEGMKTFYDKIVPNAMKALLKKVGGGQVEAVTLTGEPIVLDKNWTTREFEARRRLGIPQDEWDRLPRVERQRLTFGEDAQRVRNDLQQPGFTITDAMRRQVEQAGLPRFASREQTTGDYGRSYSPEQRKMFQNVGRTFTRQSMVDKLKDFRKDMGRRLAQGIVDQFRPLRELGGNAYTLARLSKGSSGAFEALLHHGKLSIKDGAYDADMSGGFLERVGLQLGRELEDFMWWIAANRAERLSAEDREHLFTPADIAAGKSLATGQMDHDYTLANGQKTRDRATAYRDALKQFDAFNKNVLDMAEQSGLIDGVARQFWDNEFYVPFYRVSEEDGAFMGMKIKGGLARQRAFQQLKGGSQKLNSDLTANVMRNWAHLIDAAAKNRAARATLESAAAMGGAVEADQETIRQMGKAAGGPGGTVWFMDGGRQRHFLVEDPYLLAAINSLEYAGMRGPLMDALSTTKHWLTVGVTASPGFKVRNLIRDSLQAISLAELSYNPFKNIADGVKLTGRDQQTYVSSLASGGLIRFGTQEASHAERVRKLVQRGVDPATILDTTGKIKHFVESKVSPLWDAYQELGERGEEINRAALYHQLVSKGMDHAEAALAARDLMDFSMQGTWGGIRFLTQVVPFLNARLQGMYKLGRSATANPQRFAVVTGAVALMSIALLAAYGDDDDWKKRDEMDRDGFWWFKLGGTAFRIPKPFEIGAIASVAERGVELFTNDEFTRERFLARMKAIASDNLSMNPVPQMVKPMLAIYANKDSFSGRQIETMGMERLQSEYRFDSSTSLLARGLSAGMNAVTRNTVDAEALSPVQIDYLIRGYLGWLGTSVVATGDWFARHASNEPERPAMDWLKVVTQGFVAQLPADQSKYVTAMYDQVKSLEEAYATHRQLVKDGRVDDAREFAVNNRDLLDRYRRVEFVKQQVSTANQEIHKIELSSLSPEEKRARISAIRAKQDRLARQIY